MGVIHREVVKRRDFSRPQNEVGGPALRGKSRSGTYLPVENSSPLPYDRIVETFPLLETRELPTAPALTLFLRNVAPGLWITPSQRDEGGNQCLYRW
jgi:hypothetical protein